LKFFVGDKVKVFATEKDGTYRHLYDGLVVEANDDEARVQIREGTYGFWFSQADGNKVGVYNGRFISKSFKWRSIDDE
jgi:hypothetical protein